MGIRASDAGDSPLWIHTELRQWAISPDLWPRSEVPANERPDRPRIDATSPLVTDLEAARLDLEGALGDLAAFAGEGKGREQLVAVVERLLGDVTRLEAEVARLSQSAG